MWMALGLPPGGKLLSLERDDRCAAVAQRHLDLSAAADRVELRVGDALQSLEALGDDEGPFDLVFLDADKKRCTQYYELLMSRELLHPHSLVLIDNVLWKGRVLGLCTAGPAAEGAAAPAGNSAEERAARRDRVLTQAMHEFNVKVRKERRVEQVVLPLRDGLSLIRVL